MGQVVVLNGASSAGKSSIARALQARWPAPMLRVGIDTVIAAWPATYVAGPDDDVEGVPAYRIVAGAGPAPSWVPLWGEPLLGLMRDAHRHWAALAVAGWDLVVDHVFFDASLRDDAREVLSPALWVGVTCPVGVLVAREAARGDRHPGFASGTWACAHDGLDYDLVVDTSVVSAEVAAERVLAALRA